ncbi:MAG: DHHW family protein [Candidatus Gastranaerophilaceae bacterium]
MRESFINHNNFKLLFSSNWQTKNVIKGKSNWLFLGWPESIESYSNSRLFSQEELDSITGYLSSVNDYCKKNNKKFYFFITPDKSNIYQEFYPDRIKKISKTSKTEQLIEHLKNNSEITVIYPQSKLIRHKKESLLYWKSDTHWNSLGAYYGYEELMKYISQDFPDIKTYKVKKFIEESHNGDLYEMAPGILRKQDKTVYKVPAVSNNLCTKEQTQKEIISCNNSSQKYNLLMFRDSFSTSLIPYLSHTFKKSKYYWVYNVSPSQMEDADIIILEVVERYLPLIVNSYME